MNKEKIIQQIDKLPGFSTTLTKVLQLSGDPKAASKDIIHAISLDPTLTARVLKLINSAYFGMSQQVVSLNRAVVMLGMNTIKNVAISSSVVKNLFLPNTFKWFKSDQFWEHSLGVAVGAKLVASRMGVSPQDREEFFIAGLLHDIGKVVLIQRLPEEYAHILDPSYEAAEKRVVLESRELGIAHTDLGGLIADKWKLPAVLKEAITRHHDPSLNGGEFDKVMAAVHVADIYCNRKEIGIKNQGSLQHEKAGIWDYLAFEPGQLDGIFKDIGQKIDEAKIFLKQ